VAAPRGRSVSAFLGYPKAHKNLKAYSREKHGELIHCSRLIPSNVKETVDIRGLLPKPVDQVPVKGAAKPLYPTYIVSF